MPQWAAGTRTLPPVSPPAREAGRGQDCSGASANVLIMRCCKQQTCYLPTARLQPRLGCLHTLLMLPTLLLHAPSPMSASPAATAAAVPLEEPPVTRPGAAGFVGAP